MQALIQAIIEMEWDMFHSTQNIGGTASCQNNRLQFEIMRKSQFLVWNKDILQSYLDDLTKAVALGENLVSFKYAYMMEHTAPIEYLAIKDKLPSISEEKRKMVEILSQQTVRWAEAFAEKYPNLVRLGRPIHSYEDQPYSVSMETYSRGEWLTYSEKTLLLLTQYYQQLVEAGRNIQEEVLAQELALSGLGSLEETEQRLSGGCH